LIKTIENTSDISSLLMMSEDKLLCTDSYPKFYFVNITSFTVGQKSEIASIAYNINEIAKNN